MTRNKVIARAANGKRLDYEIPEYRRMCAARQVFIVAMHDWLHRADPREGQIEVDGTVSQLRQTAAIVDPRIVPGQR